MNGKQILFSVSGIEIPLYDKNERPVWQVLPHSDNNEKRTLISIPISQEISNQKQIAASESSFLATEQLPKQVFLSLEFSQMTNNEEISLSIPISIALSLADYFLYSDKLNEKDLQNKIEKRYNSYQNCIYDDVEQIIDVNFKINRKNFAEDMMEMILVLLEQNMDKVKEITSAQTLQEHNETNQELEKRRRESKEISELLQTNSNLMKEMQNITEQFQDVLEPSIFDRIDTIFKIMMTKQNSLAGLSLLVRK